MSSIWQTTFSPAFSWMKSFVFGLEFHRSLSARAENRRKPITWTKADLVHRRIYAALEGVKSTATLTSHQLLFGWVIYRWTEMLSFACPNVHCLRICLIKCTPKPVTWFCEDHVLIITLRPKQNACHFRTHTNDYFEQWKLVYWRIYALPVFGELNQWTHVPVIMSDTHKIWTIYPELIISRTHLSVWSRQGGRNKARLWGRDSSAVGTRYMVPSLLFSIWTTCIVVCSPFILVYAKSIVRLRSVFCGM